MSDVEVSALLPLPSTGSFIGTMVRIASYFLVIVGFLVLIAGIILAVHGAQVKKDPSREKEGQKFEEFGLLMIGIGTVMFIVGGILVVIQWITNRRDSALVRKTTFDKSDEGLELTGITTIN